MALQAVGSTLVLLQLVGAAQDAGEHLSVDGLWLQVASSAPAGPYLTAALDAGRPDTEFLADLAELEVYGLIGSRADGLLEITSLGRLLVAFRASARDVASPLPPRS